jgi:hypothetical protein
MSDTGMAVDVVVAGMLLAACALALLLLVPATPFGRAAGPAASTLVAASLLGGASILSAPASIYADGSTHWDDTPHGGVLIGAMLAILAIGLLIAARWRDAVLRWGLGVGFVSAALLTASQFAYHTPG